MMKSTSGTASAKNIPTIVSSSNELAVSKIVAEVEKVLLLLAGPVSACMKLALYHQR